MLVTKRSKLLARTVSLICVIAMTAVLFVGCNGAQTGTQVSSGQPDVDSSSSSQEEKPFEMTVLGQSYTAEPPKDTEPVFLKIQEYTNTKLNVTWVSTADLDQKLSITLASGDDMPMTMFVTSPKKSYIVNAVNGNVFWELDSYIKEFPNLSESDPIRLANSAVSGKIVGLYRERPLAMRGYIYRSDWLENLGMEPPETIEEFYNLQKAFTENDPDQNGKDDTFGLSMDQNWFSEGIYGVLLAALGGPNKWSYQDGGMIPEFEFDEYMEMLDLYKRLYDEGLMNRDFAVAIKKHDNINSSKAGGYLSFMSNAASEHTELYKLNPNARLDIVGVFSDELDNKKTVSSVGFDGIFMFPKNGAKDEETLRKCMNFFDKMSDKPMQNLLRWGFEGKHYVVEDGVNVRTSELNEAYTREVNPFRSIKLHYDNKADPGKFDYAYQRARELYVEMEPYVVANPCEPFVSETYGQIGVQLDEIIFDASTKYIMGVIDKSGFEKEIENWRNQGGNKVIEEFTKAYEAAKN